MSGVPPALMGSTGQPQVQSDDKMSEKGWYGKCKQKGGGWDDPDIIKKQKQQDGKGSPWRDNKNFDLSLKSTKQNIIKVHDQVNLGILVNAQGSTTAKVLMDLGFQATLCRQFLLWGACGKNNCQMMHDDIKLVKN